MSRKLIVLSGFLVFTVAAIVLYSVFFNSESYTYRQVKKIAIETDNTLLKINRHISETKRPEEVFNFPIEIGQLGPAENLYSGSNQYPFYCMTLDSKLGQPVVDNKDGFGVPVYRSIDQQEEIVGYSKDCGAISRLSYYRINKQQEIIPINELTEQTSPQDSVFRIEQGTINRFIYTIVMPITRSEVGNRLAKTAWNKRLIYQFNGGSGIGFRQGKQAATKVIKRRLQQLLDGYAVISSSGNRTSNTYNMLLAEDTARRVKKQFTSLYGQPLYTVGVGASGGGIAQYLIAQNSRGILDGLLPLYSYPDMITQTTYAFDCDLLNNYFIFRAKKRKTWQDWTKRQTIEGLNTINNFPQKNRYLQPINQLMAGFVPTIPKGNSECINGYFGLSSFINNPKQGFIRDFFHPDVVKNTQWSYWQDLVHILGTNEQGYALSTWDNVGVQYGLVALKDSQISIAEFIDINKKIGSWQPQDKMKAEFLLTPFGHSAPLWLSLWGNQNISKLKNNLAPRHMGSVEAMQAAYRSGQVFIGKVSLPIIDIRHYLEDDLDMHHVSATFYSRLRIEQANGHAKNHIVWLAHKNFNPVPQAFKIMDQWLLGTRSHDVVAAKPKNLQDSCFANDGSILARGDNIWDGSWNNKALGACQKVYPMYSTSRIQAGANFSGDTFKCQLIPISKAIDKGIYGDVNVFDSFNELMEIFPLGVCDYEQRDVGRPSDI
jgi:hypothetical protein